MAHRIVSDVNIKGQLTVQDDVSAGELYGDASDLTNLQVDETLYLTETSTNLSDFSFIETDPYSIGSSNKIMTQKAYKEYVDNIYKKVDKTQGFVVAGSSSGNSTSVIQKFDFSSNVTASSHGNIRYTTDSLSGNQSSINGYTSGGYNTSSSINRFLFSSNTEAIDHGILSSGRRELSAQSSKTQGFNSGGLNLKTIDKFDFSSNIQAVDHGDLIIGKSGAGGHQSSTQGFSSAGLNTGGTVYASIDAFDFSSNITATDHGDLSQTRAFQADQSSDIEGFACGGNPFGTTVYSTIEKFNFATASTVSGHGDISFARGRLTGCSGATQGFSCGGYYLAPGTVFTTLNIIDKFDYSSNVTSLDHGDLFSARSSPTGVEG
jgi:hypothetical protein